MGRAVGLLVAAGLVLGGCGAETSAELDGFRAGPGDTQITVGYLQRPPDSAGRVVVVAEEADRVRVKVLYRAAGGSQDDIAVSREAVGELSAPLGDRWVVGERGEIVLRKS